jgi:hypothetical protein
VIALGLALTLVAAGATVLAVVASASSSTTITLTAFGVRISASALDLFVAGAVAAMLLGLGFALISRGTRRSARRHKELKLLRKDKAIAASKATAEREGAGARERAEHRTSDGRADVADQVTATSHGGTPTLSSTERSEIAPGRRERSQRSGSTHDGPTAPRCEIGDELDVTPSDLLASL